MRKGLIITSVLLSSAIALSGCMSNKTGDLGNKNIRPNSVGSGMKMRFANDQDNAQNRSQYGERKENNNVIGMHGNSRLQTSDKVADKIAKMPGIGSAFVMMTDHSAYVAVKQDRHAMSAHSMELANAMKDKIADQVRAMSPSVENVYVSANPDFTSRMQGYANDVRRGHPIQGFLAEFNALVERVFPAPSGTRNR
ncbi:YhcN/YlaJ family sporulation lipoprotein [Cohnella silvisoli]|uniref:YhcN/YlaJ family sporulation lipoprotein n=1 Tax=Cohnella silvisoli TaxID=2873699 RepID=A0ABV1L1R7_9BACL|nr:YhcN/YlaJ family sporulation lipoprotein [Cohnella silvisoli]MCD9025957.1 YhcN/YlaJ family sporulation lipoprotein [Cohnella silvisoli]